MFSAEKKTMFAGSNPQLFRPTEPSRGALEGFFLKKLY